MLECCSTQKMCLGGYQCLFLLTVHLICIMTGDLHEKHAYYDNIYLSEDLKWYTKAMNIIIHILHEGII